jgi:hypothetical protein
MEEEKEFTAHNHGQNFVMIIIIPVGSVHYRPMVTYFCYCILTSRYIDQHSIILHNPGKEILFSIKKLSL